VYYKLLGWATWKAIRRYAGRKGPGRASGKARGGARRGVPRRAVAAAIVLAGLAVLSALARARDAQ
jgi:hypothetical protein